MYLLISVSAAKRTKAGRLGLYLGPQSIQCVGNIGKILHWSDTVSLFLYSSRSGASASARSGARERQLMNKLFLNCCSRSVRERRQGD